MTIDYLEYLQTPEWAAKRQDAIKRARYRCQVCNHGGKLHVHHRTYDRLGNEDPEDLTVLCSICHTLFHVRGRWASKAPTHCFARVSEIMAAMISDDHSMMDPGK